MSPDEHASTGRLAHTGDVPRTGAFPRNPYAPKSAAELSATDGGSCPSWAWDHSAHAKNNEAVQLLRSLPLPRPLPPVYTHSVYRAEPELRSTKQRLLHIFTVCVCAGVGVWMVVFVDWRDGRGMGAPVNPPGVPYRRHVFSGVQEWAHEKLAKLKLDPRAMHEQRRRALEEQQQTAAAAKAQ